VQIPTLFWWRIPTRGGTQITDHVIASRDMNRQPSAKAWRNFNHQTAWKNGVVSDDVRFSKIAEDSTTLCALDDIERKALFKFFAKVFSFLSYTKCALLCKSLNISVQITTVNPNTVIKIYFQKHP
jgi:hypothetical protein